MPGIGPLEIGIVLLIVLIIFGPKRLPGLGRSIGSGMREFKDSITGKDDDAKPPSDQIDAPAGGEESASESAREPAAKS